MDDRQQSLQNWVQNTLVDQNLGNMKGSLVTVSGDASFRRYFRQATENATYIAVDAPPEKENSEPFVRIAKHWFEQGVNVPEVLAWDESQGFMLLSDMGDQLLLPLLTEDKASDLYHQAMDALVGIQQTSLTLPEYDQALLDREMQLFPDWFLVEHLGMDLNGHDRQVLSETFELLRETALGQVQVPVHRDYHSRNLMLLADGSMGIIDFQDAVNGAITYDLVSLLRDAYIAWPKDQVETWALDYFEKAKAAGLVGGISPQQWLLWFDWMGLQRHIKVVGIFARLCYRDGKAGYMQDIPRTFRYIADVAREYDALTEFSQWIEQRLLPFMAAKGDTSLIEARQ